MLFSDITVITQNIEAISGMYVGVTGDRIAYVGHEKPGEDYGRIYNGRGKVLMPAFVNAHGHSPMTLMRGYGENMTLSDWLNTRIFPFEAHLDEDAVYWGTKLAMAESVRNGIVSTTDMYYMCGAMAEAVLDVGCKANISWSVANSTEKDLWDLPGFIAGTEFAKKYFGAGDGKIIVDTSIHAEYTNTEKTIRQMAEYTRRTGANMHVHLSETREEHMACIEKYGMTPAALFDSLGLFDTRATAAHCVWVSEDDVRILKNRDVSVACNPISNLKLASGVCDVNLLLAEGINVALGTDSVASNNSLNFIEEMKVMAIASKGFTGNPSVVSPRDVIRAATMGGAIAQGRKDCGRIEEHCIADLIVLDVDKPHMYPVHDIINNIVYSAQGSDVVLTMADGQVLYEDGEYKTLNVQEVVEHARSKTAEILKKL